MTNNQRMRIIVNLREHMAITVRRLLRRWVYDNHGNEVTATSGNAPPLPLWPELASNAASTP